MDEAVWVHAKEELSAYSELSKDEQERVLEDLGLRTSVSLLCQAAAK